MSRDGVPEASVIIPALNEGESIGQLVARVRAQLVGLGVALEVLVVDGGSTDETVRSASDAGARVVSQGGKGYADALRTGFQLAHGRFLITMDADYSHDPDFLGTLWRARHQAPVVIASRYVPGGYAAMPLTRRLLSVILNSLSRSLLSVPVRDLSSGFRLYDREVLKGIRTEASQFDVLIELLVLIFSRGWGVAEVPFHYRPRFGGRSHVRLWRFAKAYARTLVKLWTLRNSLKSADYDDRAFSSRILIQRYWQRRRYTIVLDLLGRVQRALDAGCGSSKILEALPHAVGLDLNFAALRFRKRTNKALVNGDVRALPFKAEAFDAIICSEVLQQIRDDPRVFRELGRVLAKGGVLILGTPDYGRWQWRWIEWWYTRLLPDAHGRLHVQRYTAESLAARLSEHGFVILESRYICGAELILRCKKQGAVAGVPA
jgi:dolichol-phosphate mannosyltransferase